MKYDLNTQLSNKCVACSSCRDTIKEVYGTQSEELANFNRSIRSSDELV